MEWRDALFRAQKNIDHALGIINWNEPGEAGFKAHKAQRLNQGLEEAHRGHNISKRWGLVFFWQY